MKSKIEKYRIGLSRLAAAIFFFLICTVGSYWETENMYISLSLFSIGILFVGIASLGRLWCSLYIAGYKNKSLITEGPYSVSRNPLYFFSAIGVTGVGFATETASFPIALIILFSIYYPMVIKKEENAWN